MSFDNCIYLCHPNQKDFFLNNSLPIKFDFSSMCEQIQHNIFCYSDSHIWNHLKNCFRNTQYSIKALFQEVDIRAHKSKSLKTAQVILIIS